MATLLEKYTNRLTRANNEYKARTGRQLTESKKMLTAAVLENTAKFMNFRMNRMTEALDNSMGVQTTDVGNYKRFVLDVTETAMPNLVGPEICYVHTMDALSGWATYRKYTAGSRKGVRNSDGTFTGRFNQDDSVMIGADNDASLLRGTFANGKPQSEYTSKAVSTKFTGTGSILRWTPVLPGSVLLDDGTNWIVDDGNGGFGSVAQSGNTMEVVRDYQTGAVSYKFYNATTGAAVTPSEVVGAEIIYGTVRDDNYDAGEVVEADLPKNHGQISGLTSATYTLSYQYDNEYIPQNDIPLINVKTEAVYLKAHARRIAIYYSQLAEFEAQKDYGYSVGEDLKQQAEYQIQCEIDTEILKAAIGLGKKNADVGGIYSGANGVTWYTVAPIGVNMRDHYETINVALATADARLFNQTQKFSGTYILVGPLGLRYFSMNSAFKMLSNNRFGFGPYVAGECMGKKVIVTPVITDGSIYVGVNSGKTSALIYGIYMPIVPSQLLQFADFSNSMGFATLYDLQVLNPQLVIKIDVIEGREPTTVTVVDNG